MFCLNLFMSVFNFKHFFLAGYPANETRYQKRPDIRCNRSYYFLDIQYITSSGRLEVDCRVARPGWELRLELEEDKDCRLYSL